ncbi:MAG: hypothetical protein H9W81_18395 [Enterococcus sp.]|nr:hypothetical protein [Enterococcus sp.]
MDERQELTRKIWQRLEDHGVTVDREKYPTGNLSSLDICELSEETGRSIHWLITSERDPHEIKLVHCENPYPFTE